VRANLIRRATIINSVLLGACYFFFSIWGGNQRGIACIKSMMINYLADGGVHRARAKVGWIQCCQDKSRGGLNLVHPDDAVIALMGKWIVKAMEPGSSNLHAMLRYRLSSYQPYSGGRWENDLAYFTVSGHQSRQGSLGWNRTILAWKALLPDPEFVLPVCLDDLLSCSLWFCPLVPLIGPGFSKSRASALHKAGLRRYRDAMVEGRLLSAEEV
jgi:hypothetical protein